MKRIEPGPGQESVWDYPRPPRLEKTHKTLRVEFNGTVVARTSSAYRVLETSHPPTYYFPPEDVKTELLTPAEGQTMCEWKGAASYFDLEVNSRRAARAVWTYRAPYESFSQIAGYYCFYPSMMDACYVGDERVESQEGDYYGGWITKDIVGPFKGRAGTGFW